MTPADFDHGFQTTAQAEGGSGNYIVRAGDSLESIARNLWGDSELWFLLADANGLFSSAELVAGMSLTIPNKLANVHNNADTFKPYNPGHTVGDTAPTIADPAPPISDDGGCGVIGQIIVVVVVIVVAYFTGGAALQALGYASASAAAAGGAAGYGALILAGAAAGSIAGQLTGI